MAWAEQQDNAGTIFTKGLTWAPLLGKDESSFGIYIRSIKKASSVQHLGYDIFILTFTIQIQ